jgi:hypothetical protein
VSVGPVRVRLTRMGEAERDGPEVEMNRNA